MHVELKEATIEYRDGDAELAGLLVWDGAERSHPGVLVVHGGAGLDDHAKGRSRQLAELGLLVFACDMYGKAVTGDRERVMSCVLELARSGAELTGAVSVHGTLETANPAGPGAVKAKVLVCHGALDPHVPTAQVTGFIEEMNAAGADYQLIVYGGAMHGFTHNVGPQAPGVAYHAVSDERSFKAIKAFLAESSTPRPRRQQRRR